METLDRQRCNQIATLIRNHIDEVARESFLRYKKDYPFSVNASLNEHLSLQWARGVFLYIAEQLGAATVDAQEYANLRGDIVLQKENLAYPIEALIEEGLIRPALLPT